MNIFILCIQTYKHLRVAYETYFFIIDKISLFVFLSEFLVKIALFKLDYCVFLCVLIKFSLKNSKFSLFLFLVFKSLNLG